MKIQLINENTIKVTITKRDFQIRNIDIKNFKPGSDIYRQLILEIMAQAAYELDFKSDNCKVVVEGHVSQADEVTLLITKYDTETPSLKDADIPGDNPPPGLDGEPVLTKLSEMMHRLAEIATAEGKDSGISNISDLIFPADLIIAFSDFDKLIDFVHGVPEAKKIASTMYEYDSTYFLVFKVYERNAKLAVKVRNLSTEYDGVQLPIDIFVPVLLEHGNLIIKKGAVPTLQKKFNT